MNKNQINQYSKIPGSYFSHQAFLVSRKNIANLINNAGLARDILLGEIEGKRWPQSEILFQLPLEKSLSLYHTNFPKAKRKEIDEISIRYQEPVADESQPVVGLLQIVSFELRIKGESDDVVVATALASAFPPKFDDANLTYKAPGTNITFSDADAYLLVKDIVTHFINELQAVGL